LDKILVHVVCKNDKQMKRFIEEVEKADKLGMFENYEFLISDENISLTTLEEQILDKARKLVKKLVKEVIKELKKSESELEWKPDRSQIMTIEESLEKEKKERKGKFEQLKEYILRNTVKLPNGTPMFSARYFARMIEQAKKEFPKRRVACDLAEMEEKTGRWWATPSYDEVEQWFKKWFGEKECEENK